MSVAFFLSSLPKIAVFLQFFLLQSIDLAPLDLQQGSVRFHDYAALFGVFTASQCGISCI